MKDLLRFVLPRLAFKFRMILLRDKWDCSGVLAHFGCHRQREGSTFHVSVPCCFLALPLFVRVYRDLWQPHRLGCDTASWNKFAELQKGLPGRVLHCLPTCTHLYMLKYSIVCTLHVGVHAYGNNYMFVQYLPKH